MGMEDTIHTVEVRQSFNHNSSFYPSYLMRTILEFIFGLLLTCYMVFSGIGELINWNTQNLQDLNLDDLVDIKSDNLRVICDVHGDFYECAGVPTQFYLYVLMVAVILLILYLLTTFITIIWLICPSHGKLSSFMSSYRSQLETMARSKGGDTSSKALLGELHEIYYENRDLKLLLDLLSITSGLSPALR